MDLSWFYTLSTIAQAVASILSLSAIIFIFQLERISSRADRSREAISSLLQAIWGPNFEFIMMGSKEILDKIESTESRVKINEFEETHINNKGRTREKIDIATKLLKGQINRSFELRKLFLIPLVTSLFSIITSVICLTFTNYFHSNQGVMLAFLIGITLVAFFAALSNGYFWYRLARIDR
jgi:hypothetical protein